MELAFSGSFAFVKRADIQTRLGTIMHSPTKICYQNMRKNFCKLCVVCFLHIYTMIMLLASRFLIQIQCIWISYPGFWRPKTGNNFGQKNYSSLRECQIPEEVSTAWENVHLSQHKFRLFSPWRAIFLAPNPKSVDLDPQGWAMSRVKGTQEWEFFWLRFWILYYFIVSYA